VFERSLVVGLGSNRLDAHSDLPDVDLIVFFVRPDEAHVRHVELVVDPDHEPVPVALDVETTRSPTMLALRYFAHVRRRAPVLLLQPRGTSEERSFGVREISPENRRVLFAITRTGLSTCSQFVRKCSVPFWERFA